MLKFIKHFLFVKRCFICGKIIKFTDITNNGNKENISGAVCKSCIENLAFTNYAPIIKFKAIQKGCNYFTKAIAPFYYVSSIKRAIIRFKFKNQKRLSAVFARYMYIAISENYFYKDIDCIIPIPISSKRLRRRGYNQSLALAQELELAINKPVIIDVLIKIKDNETQSKLIDVADRIKNVENSYTAFNINKIKNKKILLIDDVITTGATVNEASKVLYNSGAREIVIVTIAYAKNI